MREAECTRKTNETDVMVKVNLDGRGQADIDTGIGFFNHMLELFAFHGKFDLQVKASGDLEVDDHHTVEDIGIAMGTAFRKALGERKGIRRYGFFLLPMDESLAEEAIDISGRPYLVFQASFNREKIGTLSTEMIREFFYAFAMNAGMTIHILLRYGDNDHHKAEAIFKCFGHALQEAVQIISDEIPSTKGMLQ